MKMPRNSLTCICHTIFCEIRLLILSSRPMEGNPIQSWILGFTLTVLRVPGTQERKMANRETFARDLGFLLGPIAIIFEDKKVAH